MTKPPRGTSDFKLAIVGPGRSGTTFLVELFEAWGFSVPAGDFYIDAQAGRESRLGSPSSHEIDKDPWAYEYISRMPEDEILKYNAFLIPIRDVNDASRSRSVQERVHRAVHQEEDLWRWDSWGTVPGGALSRTSADAIRGVLEHGLWTVVETLARNGIQPIFLHFPRIAVDFDYLWDQIGHLMSSRLGKDQAKSGFDSVADMSRVRIGQQAIDVGAADVRELTEVVNLLRSRVRRGEAVTADLERQLNESFRSRESLQQEINDLTTQLGEVKSTLADTRAERDALNDSHKTVIDILGKQIDEQDCQITSLLRTNGELIEEIQEMHEHIDRIRSSASLRLGLILLWPLRHVKNLFRSAR